MPLGSLYRTRFSMKRRFGVIFAAALAITVVGSLPGASQARSGPGHVARSTGGLELTFKKWLAPGFPNLVGVVGGDIVGQFGGAVMQATPDASGRFLHLTAIYIVVAPDPGLSFTARVEVVQDNKTNTAVLDGRVVDGNLKGAHVHGQYAVISCKEAPSGTCFQGTISVQRSSQDSGD